VLVSAREAEVVLAAAEVAEALEVVDEQEDLRPVGGAGLPAPFDLLGQGGDDPAGVSPATGLDGVREHPGLLGEAPGLRMVLGGPVEDGEPGAGANRIRLGRGILGGEAYQRGGHDPER